REDFDRAYVYAARDQWDEIMEDCKGVTSARWKYIRNDMPEVPYDAGQAYLEFYRPAVHIMRDLKKAGKLSAAEAFFFGSEKPLEELYDLKNDPLEAVNLAQDPAYKKQLKRLRKKTKRFDRKMKPVADDYYPTHSTAVDILAFVKENYPKDYQQMLAGKEIGFHRMLKLYEASKE
ncbi:MAG: sulfatase, partial [Bacteroidota bacterium]